MPIPNLDLVLKIQQFSGNKTSYGSLATLDRETDRFTEEFHGGHYKDVGFEHQPHGCDLFFSALRFDTNKRSNDTVVKPGILFADLDQAPEPAVQPSVYWETSDGNTQAVWFLDRPMSDYGRWADLNKRMTVSTGADPGGWAGSKLLRVPDSVNWKRREVGKLLYSNPTVYTWSYLESNLERTDVDHKIWSVFTDHPDLPNPADQDYFLRLAWDNMSPLGRNMITRQRVPDRSLHIVKTARELIAGGLNKEQVFALLWVAPFNKWRVSTHNPQRLWNEICRIDDQ
jgi:hypothetical protein